MKQRQEGLQLLVGDVLGVASVKIDYEATGKKRSLSIPSIVSAEIEAIQGQGGDVTISGHPLCITPGEPAVVAKSKRLDYTDHRRPPNRSWPPHLHERIEVTSGYRGLSMAGPLCGLQRSKQARCPVQGGIQSCFGQALKGRG